MTSDFASQIPRPTKIGFLRLLGGILALAAEGTVMAMLMVMAGICALGSLTSQRGPPALPGWQ